MSHEQFYEFCQANQDLRIERTATGEVIIMPLTFSDTLRGLQAKMQEYLDNGAKLGWLIDRKHRSIHIYRPDRQPEILDHPEVVRGDPELPAFVFRTAKIW